MTFEHISEPLTRAIETCAANYVKGTTMFDKSQLPDITEREKAFELHRVWEGLSDAAYQMESGDVDFEPGAIEQADAKAEEAEDAYRDCGIDLLTDARGNAVRCAVSNVPILESDEVEIVLRVAIGLPPRPSEPEEQMLPDMEGVA